MDYKHYDTEDFAKDAFFIRWVRNPDKESDWFWNAFLKEHPQKRPQVEEARRIVLSLSSKAGHLREDEVSAMRDHLLMAIRADQEKEKEEVEAYPRRRRSFSVRWMQAAAVLLVAIAGVGTYRYLAVSSKDIASQQTPALPDHEPETEERVSPRGQKSVVILADGTKVWLNADSRLNFAKDFNAHGRREVFLEGEAYFDVVSNPEKPFVIHTSAIHISVLGTSFNVKSYHDDKVVETTLVQGRVSIAKDDNGGTAPGPVVLKPNQKAVFEKRTRTINVEEVAAEQCAPWRYDRLVFDGTPFSDVITQLERWYNVRIHVDETDALTCALTADIESESLEEVLKLLQTTNSISYAISGSDVYIRGKFCD